MTTSLRDQQEVKHLWRLHVRVACAVIIALYFVVNTTAAISAAFSYGGFLITWLLSAYYAFRYRGAQQIKPMLLGFYWGSALKLTLTLLWISVLMRYWHQIDWLIFLLVMLLSYVVSLVGGLTFYRRSTCG